MDIVQANTPQELLLALPHIAGAEIANSVVIVPFHGSRSGIPARVDLPQRIPASESAAWAANVLAPMGGVDASAIGLFVVTDAEIGTGKLPCRGVVRSLRAAAKRMGMPLRASLCLARDAWGDYEWPDGARGPLAELELLGTLPFIAPVKAPGLPLPASSRLCAAVAALFERRLSLLDEAPQHDECQAGIPCAAFPPESEHEVCEMAADPELMLAAANPPLYFEHELHRAAVSLEAMATLIALMQSPPRRDTATAQWLDGFAAGERAYEEALDYVAFGKHADGRTASRIIGEGAAPEHQRLARAIDLMERLCSVAPRAAQPSLLTILGSLHWYMGRAATAERCLMAALAISETASMASLMLAAIQSGRLPDWIADARRQRATA